MADKQIIVQQGIKTTATFVLTDFRSEYDPTAVVDITGYTIRLLVKRDRGDVDSLAWIDITATLVSVADGIFSFELASPYTSLPAGTWPGIIRFWSGSTSLPPDEAWSVDYVVEPHPGKP
jgi:hypothetical protein